MTNTERVLNVPDHDRMLKGVKFLDKHFAGWAERINMLTFDIQSSQDCVIAQLFGEPDDDGTIIFGHAVADMWLEADYEPKDDDEDAWAVNEYDWAAEYGFDSFDDYLAANDAWRRVIRARR